MNVYYEPVNLEESMFCSVFLHDRDKTYYNSDACTIENVPHFHPAYELTYSHIGSGSMITSKDRVLISSGEIIFIDANVVHYCPDGSDGVRGFYGVTIRIPVDVLTRFFTKKVGYFKLPADSEAYKTITSLMKRVYFLTLHRNDTYVLEINAIVLQILTTLINQCQTSSKEAVMNNMGHYFVEYILKNYTRDITLNDIATAFGYNRAYFSSIFHQETGVKFSDLLSAVRLEHAHFLLSCSNETLSNIARQSGFKNTRAFSDLFRKRFKVLPGEYREQNYTLTMR